MHSIYPYISFLKHWIRFVKLYKVVVRELISTPLRISNML